ncbi:FAD-dependent monooxygenase [Alteromonas halophila]|uniref:2-octaprenyl-6-methoxyphenol hydroxylase n=1 Tax=Alteromonas halophila TaxID=516698 RepID=A0A918JP17_9ALTE|nr:FAD-dependent monooxygenase [Alteromonas halophila]GGW93839.1 2-octaprenyl-6-methoxyphenol hydroxylase [Alteromonas halophila]
MKQVDIAVVGGGIVGLTLVSALADSGLTVAVISDAPLSQPLKATPDVRVSAINAVNAEALSARGIWSQIRNDRVCPYNEMDVWDKDSFGHIHFDCHDMQSEQLGHIVENQALVNALADGVASQQNVVVAESRIARILWGQEQTMLMLDNDDVIAARLVVGADGANSFIRKQASLPVTFKDYGQTAIVTNIHTEQPHNNTARQVFTPDGPLAMLPLNHPNHCSIVFSQTTTRANALLAMDESEFCKALTEASGAALGTVSLNAARQHFPLMMRYARQWLSDGVVLVGDAAHTIHPLAGQGANLGMQDALSLASHLTTLKQQDKDFSQRRALRPFERERKAKAMRMIAAMDGFKTLFAGHAPLKKFIRGAGLSAANSLPGVKRHFIAEAMGL